MAKAKKTSAPRKLVVQQETLRQLSGTTLSGVAGGANSGHCDNRSYGFLCGDLCGNSKSCQD